MDKVADFDVIIVGGGMVGATLACALALNGSGLRIAVVEHLEPAAFSPEQPHDLRVSALSVASQRLLEQLTVWDAIKARRCCPYRRMRVWETAQWGDTLFESGDISEPVLGHIVENRIIQLALWERMLQCPQIELFCPATVKTLDYQPGGSEVLLDDGRLLRGHLLVGADGGQSQVRQRAGIGIHSWDYAQQALVASVETAYPQQDITWQKFVPSGPMAFLPLPGNFASLVWYHRPAEVSRLLALPDDEFLAEASRCFPPELGEIKRLLGRASFPLKRQHALQYCKRGVVLIGDAAHMIHPLAGQGVNIGLLDAAALAETLAEAIRQHEDIGALEVLKRYQRQRWRYNLMMMTTMDLFQRVFGRDQLPVKLLRNLGLGLAQHLTPAKNRAMRLAMGLDEPLTKVVSTAEQ